MPEQARLRWSGSARSVVMPWLMTMFLVITLAIIVISNGYAEASERIEGWAWAAPVIALGTGIVLSHMFARVRVELTDDMAILRFGIGWPVQRISWDKVATVQVTDVRPAQWGGWGYRRNLRKKTTAAIMRAGEGLHFTFADGRSYIVTVDEADAALRVIRTILNDR